MLPGTVTSSKVQPTTNFAVFSLFGLDSKIVKSDRTDTRDFFFFFYIFAKISSANSKTCSIRNFRPAPVRMQQIFPLASACYIELLN